MMRPRTSRGSIARRAGSLIAALATILALAAPAAAREPVDPSTLNPAPPAEWDVSCDRLGSGIICDLSFDDPAFIDEPSGIVCGGVELLVSQTRSVVGKRFYDANGDLLVRHFRETLAGSFTNPDTGLVATWVQHDTVIHDLGTPGDLGTGTTSLSGLITRVLGPDGQTILIEAGSSLEDSSTGDLLRLDGPHPFFEYFALGDGQALQPLCDALD
jgi:hypothetical protein